MSRKMILVFLLVFSITAVDLSWADVFRCRRPDGSVFLTNDPAQVPKGCTIERVNDLPPLGVLPDTSAKAPSPAVAEKSTAAQAQSGEARTFESLISDAVQLAEKARAARHRIATSSFVADEMNARRELADIKGQANTLRQEISRAGLSGSEKRKLDEVLAPITE